MAFDDTSHTEMKTLRIAVRFYRDDAFITDKATPGWDRSEHVFTNGRTWINDRHQRREIWAQCHSLAKWMVENPDLNAAYLNALDRKIWASGEFSRRTAGRTADRIKRSGLLEVSA